MRGAGMMVGRRAGMRECQHEAQPDPSLVGGWASGEGTAWTPWHCSNRCSHQRQLTCKHTHLGDPGDGVTAVLHTRGQCEEGR